MPKDPNEIGALWKKTSGKGAAYLSGKIDGRQVVVFVNKGKKTEKQPDYYVLLSRPKEQAASEPEPDFA
jgi:uncharacterized protein (DUF736 family)